MKVKNFTKKFSALFLGLGMTLGMVSGLGSNKQAAEAKAATLTFTDSIQFSSQGLSNGTKYTTFTGSNATINFGAGDNDGKYYDTGTGIRIYAKGYMEVVCTNIDKLLSSIVMTFSGTSNMPTSYSISDNSSLSISSNVATWSGNAESVRITNNASSGHWRLQKVQLSFIANEGGGDAEKYSVSFAKGDTGASGSMDSESVTITNSYSIPNSEFTAPTGKQFSHWSGSDGVTYKVGDSIAANTFAKDYSLTLTAVWKDLPQKPTEYAEIEFTLNSKFIPAGGSEPSEYNGNKGGTSSNGFNLNVSVNKRAKALHLYGAAWNGSNDTTITVNNNAYRLPADSGMSANSPFKLSKESLYDDNYHVTIPLSNITSDNTSISLQFNKRAGVWYIGCEYDTSVSVSNSLTNCSTNNAASTATIGGSYNAIITPAEGFGISSVVVKVDGVTNSTYVTASSKDSATISIPNVSGDIEVTAVAASLTKTLSSITLGGTYKTEYHIGEELDKTNLVVTAHYDDDSTQDVSSLATVVDFDSSAVAESQILTVSYTENEVTMTATYKVKISKVNVASVTLSSSSESLKEGQKVTLTASVNPDNATNKTVIWASDNENVATVEDGVVTAVSTGTANITATADGVSSTNCVVTVSVLATIPSEITIGHHYVITGTDGTNGNYEMGAEDTSKHVINGVAYNGQPLGVMAWEAVKGAVNGTVAFVNNEGKYLAYKELANQNPLVTSEELNTLSSWIITYDAEAGYTFSNVEIFLQGTEVRTIRYNYNSGNPRFACYKTTTLPLVNLFDLDQTCSVTFMNGDVQLSQSDVKIGTVPTAPTATKVSTESEDYTFVGWALSQGGEVVELAVASEDVTYYAVFSSTAREYTITFLDENDSVIKSSSVAYGETPTCELPTKAEDANYVYSYAWDKEIVAVTGDATYKAVRTDTPKAVAINVTADIGFTYTGTGADAQITKGQLRFSSDANIEGATSYGFLVTSDTSIVLTTFTAEEVVGSLAGVKKVNKVNATIGVSDLKMELKVVFYMVKDGVVHYSEQDTYSFAYLAIDAELAEGKLSYGELEDAQAALTNYLNTL